MKGDKSNNIFWLVHAKNDCLGRIIFLGHKILLLFVVLFPAVNVHSANITAGTNSPYWSATNVGGASYTSADNITFDSWNKTYDLISDVQCVNLTIGKGTIINLNGYTLTVTGNLSLVNNAVQINMGSSRLIINGNLSMASYYALGLFTSSSGMVELGGNFTASNNHATMAGGVTGFAGTLRFTGTSAPVISLTNAPIAIATLDWDCKSPTTLPPNFVATNQINASPCPPYLAASSLASFGGVCPNTTIGPNVFTVTGRGLTSNITLSALAGFSYSLNPSGTYTNTLSFPPDKIGLFSKPIYVKFTPTSIGSFDGNIVVGSTGASNVNVAASGNGSNTVIPTVTSPTSSHITTSSATLGGTVTIEGCMPNSITERGIYYSTTNGFPDGSGTKVSETGTFSTGAFTINVTGLSPNTTYYYKAFATNSAGTGYSVQGTFNNLPRNMYYINGGGSWSNIGNWRVGGCSGSSTLELPKASDNVFIVCGWGGNPVVLDMTGECNNLTIDQNVELQLNGNTLNVAGNVVVGSSNQGRLTVGNGALNISGNLTIQRNEGANFGWTGGTVTLQGNFLDVNGWGSIEGTRTGFFILNGTAQTFSINSGLTIPNLRQSVASFTKIGTGTLTVSTTFDRNCGPAPTVSGGAFTVTGSTINAVCTNTIATSAVSGSPFCAGASGIIVPFTYSPAANFASATFTAQLSNALGSFAAPVLLQQVASNGSGSQSIPVTIPGGTASGTGYRIRVVSNSPAVNGSNNGTNLTINTIPQGSLSANGPLCGAGSGQLTWTATSGTGPYSIVYNDGTSSRTANSVTSGNPFATDPATVSSTTNYTLVSVSDANACVRTSGFTGPSATITVTNAVIDVTAEVETPKCPDLIYEFDPNSEHPDPGATMVKFKIHRTSPLNTSWSFDYELDMNGLTELDARFAQPEAISTSPVSVGSGTDEYDLTFYIKNEPGTDIPVQLIISNLSVSGCATVGGSHTDNVLVLTMPVIGTFN